MRRGDIVTVSALGDYGKPRPAVVVQSDWIGGTDSVLVSLMTSVIRDAPSFRLSVEATPETGLKLASQVMIDKIAALPRAKCGPVIGRLPNPDLIEMNRMLTVIFGLAD